MSRCTRMGLAGLVALAAIPATAAWADGGGGRDEGSCSKGGQFRLDVQRQDARLEVRFRVDARQGDDGGHHRQARWHVVLQHDGTTFRDRVVRADGGRVEVEAMTRDHAGRDTISASAENLRTGETCLAAVTA